MQKLTKLQIQQQKDLTDKIVKSINNCTLSSSYSILNLISQIKVDFKYEHFIFELRKMQDYLAEKEVRKGV